MTHYDKGYLYKAAPGRIRRKAGQVDKSIFTVIACSKNKNLAGVVVCSKNLFFPKSFIGKKIRLKVEVIDGS